MEQLNRNVNHSQKKINEIRKNKKDSEKDEEDSSEQAIKEMALMKNRQKDMERAIGVIGKEIEENIMKVGNIIAKGVKISKD